MDPPEMDMLTRSREATQLRMKSQKMSSQRTLVECDSLDAGKFIWGILGAMILFRRFAGTGGDHEPLFAISIFRRGAGRRCFADLRSAGAGAARAFFHRPANCVHAGLAGRTLRGRAA